MRDLLERVIGFEPTTLCLASLGHGLRRSTRRAPLARFSCIFPHLRYLLAPCTTHQSALSCLHYVYTEGKMPNITKAIVEHAKAPQAGQTFIRDDQLVGFALRITAAGVRSFVWEGRIRGRVRRLTIGIS